MNKFKAMCLVEKLELLSKIKKDSLEIDTGDIKLNISIKNQDTYKITSYLDAEDEIYVKHKFEDALKYFKSIVIYNTRKTPIFSNINVFNLDDGHSNSDIACTITVIKKENLPDTEKFLDNITIINQSVHINNSLHYYKQASLTDDNKECILYLYKVVESIIGYPGGKCNKLLVSLEKLKLGDNIEKIKELRTLRNKSDSGHSAGGEKDGRTSHRDIKVENKEVEQAREIIQKLIDSSINYLISGKNLSDVFIPKKNKKKRNNIRIIAIIQARMGSTRLHGKVMKYLCGKTVLAHDIERVNQSKLIDEIAIATTKLQSDDVIVKEALDNGVLVYRGSEEDVLSRYYEAALENDADIVVRITSDCPLIDPFVIDEIIKHYLENNYDLVTNAGSDLSQRTYPRGLDLEVFSFDILKQAYESAKEAYQKEHVTPYIYENSKSIYYYKNEIDYSKYRWTLDTEEDFELINAVYEKLYKGKHDFYFEDILKLFEEKPELYEINKNVEQKIV